MDVFKIMNWTDRGCLLVNEIGSSNSNGSIVKHFKIVCYVQEAT